MTTICPFCGHDPFHYVDNGVGMEAVAVDCCEYGDALFRGQREAPETITMPYEDFLRLSDLFQSMRKLGMEPNIMDDA